MAHIPASWNGRSRGGSWPLFVASNLLPLLGQRRAWLATRLLGCFLPLLLPHSRRASIAYLRRRFPRADRATLWHRCGRHFATFIAMLLDRALVYQASRQMRWRGRGIRRFRQLMSERDQGVILLSAHIGNWELAGRLLGYLGHGRPVTLVKVANESAIERQLVEAAMGGRMPEEIDPRDGMTATLAIRSALQRGHVVCMLGDRAMDGQPAERVRLLGGTVSLPNGPFQIAATMGVPVVPIFLVRDGVGRYRLDVRRPLHPSWPRERSRRRAALHGWVQQWADELATQIDHNPYQWNNFYDYWGTAHNAGRVRSR